MSDNTRWTAIEAWCPTCGEPVLARVAITGLVPDGYGFVNPDVVVDRTPHTCIGRTDPWAVPE